MAELNTLDDPEVILKLLAVLAIAQSDDNHSGKPIVQRLYHSAQFRFPPLNDGILDGLSKGGEREFPRKLFLYFPLCGKGGHWMQPIVRASFDVNGDLPVFRLQVGLLVEDKGAEEGKMDGLHPGIGVRFESKESQYGVGDHDYAHAQWFCKFDREEPIGGCPDWLPDSYPAIPIPAIYAVDILCCALKSLYGAKSDLLLRLAKQVADKQEFRPIKQKLGRRIQQYIEGFPSLEMSNVG
ncbi:MAG: hypothetical protein KBH41_17260 [Azonexus sp.]|nr:hypothetical protein [Azonexus sp.]